MNEKFKNWCIRVKENKGLVLDFLVIGLIMGAFTQAYADTKGVDQWLQSNADTSNIISFEGHLYSLKSVNVTSVSEIVLDSNFTLNNSFGRLK